jgi:antitoxin (DNA-binding transcriptional repressor) of toxin-antitoxin stability system
MALLAKSSKSGALSSKKLKSALGRSASVAVAKANLSALLKDVEKNREEVTLLRRGVAVAKIVPISETAPQTGYGWMQGSVCELGDIVGPTGEEWTVGNE